MFLRRHLRLVLSTLVLLALGIDAQSSAAETTNSYPVLTNAAQVRALSPAQAAKKLPVRLRGVVIDNRHNGEFSFMDDTAGLYAWGPETVAVGFERGELIEVEGVSDPGKFAPYIVAHSVRKLGVAKIPAPPRADTEALFSGHLDAQWVEVVGVVRHVNRLWGALDLEISVEPGGGRIIAHQTGFNLNGAVDSTVRLRGVCYYQFNNLRQMVRPYLSIPAGEPVVVLQSAPTNLNTLPIRSVQSLMQFNPGEDGNHRVRIRGIVIYQQPGNGLWLRDAEHGLRVLGDGMDSLPVGTELDVFGFPKRGNYGPLLEDATVRKTGKTLPAEPKRLAHASEALGHDADLVECDALVEEQWRALDGIRLRVSDGNTEFAAMLPMAQTNTPAPNWGRGTKVRLAGICSVGFRTEPTLPGTLEPQFFQILLRSPGDVRILQLPSWWTAEHVAEVLGMVAAALLLAMGAVVWNSHRRLRQQAIERMKSEAEFSAVWNERNRMAREIHDTLAQGLSAISVQLEVVKRLLPSEGKARESLEVARKLAREKLADARNAIWNVRSQVLEKGDLGSALHDILRELTEGTATKGDLRIRGRVRRFAPVTENNLLRIGQEAITNAVKYGKAGNIHVALEYEERAFRLSVSDDGAGFDVQHPPPSEGGFGLVGMRERAAQMHAEFSVTSEPGEGTIVTLVLPLSS